MIRGAHAFITMIAITALLCACGNGTDKPATGTIAAQEAAEAAAMRGEPATEPHAGPAEAACTRAGGDWNSAAGQCAINAVMCATTAGNWINGTGCVVDAADESACRALAGDGGLDGFKGIQWTQGRCVLAYLAGDELASQAF